MTGVTRVANRLKQRGLARRKLVVTALAFLVGMAGGNAIEGDPAMAGSAAVIAMPIGLLVLVAWLRQRS